MKKILLFILSGAFASVFGQPLEYTFTKSTASYTALNSPTIVSNNAWTNEHVFRMPFKFKYFGKSYDTCHISATAGVSFSGVPGSSDIVFFGTEAYFPEKNNKALSPVSYIITGTTPDRVIMIEFKNFWAIQADTSEKYIVNNQIWLYETSNKIEYHFGPHTITDLFINEFYVGLIDFDNSPYYAFEGAAANPNFVRVNVAGTFKGMTTHPANGQVYTLTPNKVSVNQLAKPYMFSHLMNGFQLHSETPAVVGAYDLSGKLVQSIAHVPGQLLQHQFNNLAPGIYMINISTNGQQFVEKILIQ